MCIIYACATALPPEEELKAGAWRNDHGAGVAWVDKKTARVHWIKGLKDEKAVLEAINKAKAEPPLMIHFRIASVGGKLESLTHPFPVDKSVPLWLEGSASEVLMHNGHLSNWESLALQAGLASKERFPEGPWSDSRALAWLVHLKGAGVLPFVGATSRIALLAGTPYWVPTDGSPQDPWDYFHFYGSWVETNRDEGWISSTSSAYTNIGGRRAYSADDWDIDDMMEVRSSMPRRVLPPAAVTKENVWTVEELSALLASIEGELREAQDASGLY